MSKSPSSSTSLPAAQTKANAEIAEAATNFAFDLFKTFLNRHHEKYRNLFISPFVVFTALANMLAGSKGETEKQLEKLLKLENYNEGNGKLASTTYLIDQVLYCNNESIFYGTFMYVDISVQMNHVYRKVLKDYFEIKPKVVSFDKRSVDETANLINQDMLGATENAVDEMVTSAMLAQDVKLILVNSILFRHYWAQEFDKITKTEYTFCNSNFCKSSPISMMYKKSMFKYHYSQKQGFSAIELPYEASDLSMIVILPDDIKDTGLKLVNSLNRGMLIEILREMKKELVEVCLPKFGLDPNQVSIRGTLIEMGASDLFDASKADLSRLTPDKGIHLDRIVHKAFVIVDERGSQVSETSVNMKKMAKAKHTCKTFKADHPFCFMIIDNKTKVVLFIGLFGDPGETLEILNESEMTAKEIEEIKSYAKSR